MVKFLYQAPKYTHGNRCGHMPKFPRFFERPNSQKNPPSSILRAIEGAQNAYHNPQEFLHKIRQTRFKPSQNEIIAMNKQRSEARERNTAVISYIINHTDLISMTAVKHENGKIRPLSLLDIAMSLKMEYGRVERAIKELRNAGYLTLEYQSFYINDKFIPRLAIKRVSEKLFVDLGVPHFVVQQERGNARKQQEIGSAKKTIATLVENVTPPAPVPLSEPAKKFKSVEDIIRNTKEMLSKANSLARSGYGYKPPD